MTVVEELAVPTVPDGPFTELAEVRNAVVAQALGSDVLTLTPAELLPALSGRWRPRRLYLARWDGRAVGRATITEPVADPRMASVVIEVLPDWRRRGVGTALAERVEQRLVATGRRLVEVDVEHAVLPGPTVSPASAPGALPADDPGVRFLQRHGFTLRQVSRISGLDAASLDLPLPQVPSGYVLHTWTTSTPSRWVRDLAVLRQSMSTDEPAGDRALTVDAWDTHRVLEHDAAQAAAGRPLLVVAVEHQASGRVVGFTELSVPGAGRGWTVQEDTLVLREHRGYGLGLALKTANLRRLRVEAPGATDVVTFNKEDNGPVLSLNERLGFRPLGHEGVWQRECPATE